MSTLREQLAYTRYLVFHPFDGFWDLKHEKRGSILSGLIILLIVAVEQGLLAQYQGYIFNNNNVKYVSMVLSMTSVIAPFFLWCVSNWCLSSVMDGEGSFKDIIMSTAYALAPMMYLNILILILSNVLIADEISVLLVINGLSIFWTAGLVLIATMSVHGYSMLRTVITSAFIVVGMGLIIFVGLLFFSLGQKMFDFVLTLVKEIQLRL